MPFVPKELPFVLDPRGMPATSPHHAMVTWRNHYSKLLAGSVCTVEGLVSAAQRRQELHFSYMVHDGVH